MVEAALQPSRQRPERHPRFATHAHLRRHRALPLRARRLPGSGDGHGPDADLGRALAWPADATIALGDEPADGAGPDAARATPRRRPRLEDAGGVVGPERGA